MPIAGHFFLSSASAETSLAQDIVYRLSTTYDIKPLPPWTLSHRLFRETPGGKSTRVQGQRYLQILTLSYHAPKTHVALSTVVSPAQNKANSPNSALCGGEEDENAPTTIISIPSGGSSEEFTQLILAKFAPLWQQRQALHVSNGVAFEVNGFRIRVGEVKQGYGGGSQVTRGAICEIELLDSDAGVDGEEGASLIRAFWKGTEVKGAKEVLNVSETRRDTNHISQWCEILRLRT